MHKRKKHKKRIVTEKLTTLSDAHTFDIYFWKKAGAHARFVAAWKSIEEFYKIRGINGYKLR